MPDTISLERYKDGERAGWKNASEILAAAYGGDTNLPDTKGCYIRTQTIDSRGYRYRPIGIMFSCSQRYDNRDFKRGTKAAKGEFGDHGKELDAAKVRKKYEEVIEEALKTKREREESRKRSKNQANRRDELKQDLKKVYSDTKFKYSSEPFSHDYGHSERFEDIPVKITATSQGVDIEVSKMTVEETRQITEFIKAMRS